MKKNDIKRIISVLSATVMISSMVGCGSNSVDTTNAAQEVIEETVEETAEEKTEDPLASSLPKDDFSEEQKAIMEEESKLGIPVECTGRDNLTLRGILRKPEVEGKMPIVILSHGFLGNLESGGMFTVLSNKLAEQNIASIKFSFSGYGDSDGKLTDASIKTEIEDLKAIIEYVKTLDYVDTDNIYLAGMSMGGAVTSIVAGQCNEDIKGIALWSPAACLVDDAKAGRAQDAVVDLDNIPDEIPVQGGKYTIGKAHFLDALDVDIYGEAAKFKKKALVIHGDADKIAPISYAEKYMENYENGELVVMHGATHGYRGEELDKVCDLTVNMVVNESK